MQRCRSGDQNSNLIKAYLQVPVYSSALNKASVEPARGCDWRCRTDGNAMILPSTLRLLVVCKHSRLTWLKFVNPFSEAVDKPATPVKVKGPKPCAGGRLSVG